ncbi:MAG: glycosyltransferase [Chloroflexi bacterium]|nr:glycosyltransferase [Chloroflexota bacterium]
MEAVATQQPPLSVEVGNVLKLGAAFDGRVRNQFTAEDCRQRRYLPLRLERTTVFVGMSDPSDQALIRELTMKTSRQVHPVPMSAAEIELLIPAFFEQRLNPAAVARATGDLLREFGTQPPSTGWEEVDSLETLIEWLTNHFTPDTVIEAVSLRLNLPHLEVDRYAFEPALWRTLPPELRKRYRLAPLFRVEGALVLAVGELPQPTLRRELIEATGLEPLLALADPADIDSLPTWERTQEDNLEAGPPKASRPLLDQLLAHGDVTQGQVAGARNQALPKEQLPTTLVRLGYVTSAAIARAEATRYAQTYFDLSHVRPEDGLFDLLTRPVARRLRCFPLGIEKGVITLACANPLDQEALAAAAAFTEHQVRALWADPDAIDRLLAGKDPAPLSGTPSLASYLRATEWITGQTGHHLEHSTLATIDPNHLTEARSIISGAPWLALHDPIIPSIRLPSAWAIGVLPVLNEGGVLTVATSDLAAPELSGQLERLQRTTHGELDGTLTAVRPVLAPNDRLELLRAQLASRESSPASARVKEFSDYLRREARLTTAQLASIWQRQMSHAEPVDRSLVALELMSSGTVAKHLASFVGWEYAELDQYTVAEQGFDAIGQEAQILRLHDPVDPKVARLMSVDLAERITAIPVSRRGNTVTVAFADPLIPQVAEEVFDHLNLRITPVVAPREQVAAAIRRTIGQLNLGDQLVSAGIISAEDLRAALRVHEHTGVSLREALHSLGFVTENELAHYIAELNDMPFFDLSGTPVDAEVAQSIPEEIARGRFILPLLELDGELTLGMVDPAEEIITEVATITGLKVSPVVITESNWRVALNSVYRDKYYEQSAYELVRRFPEESASRVLSTGQKIFFIGFLAFSVVAVFVNYLAYLTLLVALSTIFYVTFSTYKFYLIYKALAHTLEVDVTDDDLSELEDHSLPVYTILVPLYKEPEVLPILIKAIDRLDYPRAKLDVKLLLEENDVETIHVAHTTKLPSHFKIVIVPHGMPKGKPKACNYGLIQATGEYVVIYDAEDIPEADQLKKAIIAFEKSGPEVACVQAKLNYFNRDQNLLTRWFTIEYSMWFDLFLPGLDASNAPIPLGGTSNHFRTEQLRKLGAWDPYNVTEDADLGIRLFKAGGKTVVIDSTTYEEANSDTYNWIRQRSRWVKGYIQTWLVHMRHPIKLWRSLGTKGFISFHLVVGGTFFSFLLNPVYWVLTALWFFTHWSIIEQLFPGPIFYIGSFGLYVGNFVFTYTNVAGCLRRGYYDLVKYALLTPIYWGLMSVAAWKGFLQLFYKPFYWEKTNHGLFRGQPHVEARSQLKDLL